MEHTWPLPIRAPHCAASQESLGSHFWMAPICDGLVTAQKLPLTRRGLPRQSDCRRKKSDEQVFPTTLQRHQIFARVSYPDRLREEDFLARVTAVDKSRMNKSFQQLYSDIKFSLVENFGAGTLNRALDALGFFARESVATSTQPRCNQAGHACSLLAVKRTSRLL